MEITISIPSQIIDFCKQCGFSEEETVKLFKSFITEMFDQDYSIHPGVFQQWFDSVQENEGLEEILSND